MDFGLERTKGTFNPDVLPRRRTVGSPVIRHCFVLVPPFVFVSLLNVQLARALRSLFHCIVMITRSTRESQVEECVSLRRFLNEDRSKFNIYENSRAESLVSGGSLKNISIGAFPFFFFAFFLDVLRALSTAWKISRRKIRSLAGGREGERRGRKPYGFPSTSSNRCSVP